MVLAISDEEFTRRFLNDSSFFIKFYVPYLRLNADC